MADLIKKIKIKKQDGTFTDYIPIGAEAQNISTSDGDSVQLKLNKKPYYYNTVADMKADIKLKAGDMVATLGYYEINDGGANIYKITNGDYTNNNMDIIELDNHLFAIFVITSETIKVEQFNIFDFQDDIRNNFQHLLDFIKENQNITKIVFSPKVYNISNYCYIEQMMQSYFQIDFNGAKLVLTTPNLFESKKALIDIQFYWGTLEHVCEIKNGIFDGVVIEPDFSPSFDPPNKGMPDVIKVTRANICNVSNCQFIDWFFTNCIGVYYVIETNIKDCIGVRCGGRSATGSGDYRGDGINITRLGEIPVYDNNGYERYYNENNITESYWFDRPHNTLYNNNYQSISFQSYMKQDFSNCVDGFANVENCSFLGYEPIDDPNPDNTTIKNGCRSGRCGIDFAEFSRADTNKILTLTNTKFYNYQRAIHYEEVKNVKIIANNCIFEEYGTGIIGADSGKSNLLFNNCIFKRTLNIRGFTTEYDTLITGTTDNHGGKVIFNDCSFYDEKSGKLAIYNKNRPIYFNNCSFELEKMSISMSEIYFKDCDIKVNGTSWYSSIVGTEKCTIEIGYKHNETSTYVWGFSTAVVTDRWPETEKIFYAYDCLFKNAKCLFNKNTKMIGNIFIFDDNCTPGTYDTVKYFHNTQFMGENSYFYFLNNIVYNNNSIGVDLFQPGRWVSDRVEIKNNTFYNVKVEITNVNNILLYQYEISNNHFKNEASHVTTALGTYGSKYLVHDNTFIGYTTNISAITNLTHYNNYKITSEGVMESID